MTKLVKGASSGIMAFGKTNAPVDISVTSGLDGEEGFEASTTFAKCVGTATFGGEPRVVVCNCHTPELDLFPNHTDDTHIQTSHSSSGNVPMS